MFNQNERDERDYLDQIVKILAGALEEIDERIDGYAKEIIEMKRYIYENKAELDSAERASNRAAVSERVSLGESAVRAKEKIRKLLLSPYFGRIDFSIPNENQEICYIGIHAFTDAETSRIIIFDWRAPISSMFYDFETGPAFYTAPMGKIQGDLTLRRQYQIRKSHLEYMIESSLNIDDEILQKELSQTSDEKMKNIVATIQREQNAIIRNETVKVLLIQGAAGSGKTSVALHRVAFLLYRYKDTLTSGNILIISPNKIFSDYISNVLPELGEENVPEISFDDIAAKFLGKKYHYQNFFQQVEELLENEDPEMIFRIEFKATRLFVQQLQSYLTYAEKKYFLPADLTVGDFFVSKEDLISRYHNLKQLPIKARLHKIAEDLIEKYKRETAEELDSSMFRQIRASIKKMFCFSDTLSLYQSFYQHLGRKDLLCFIGKNTFEYCDVFPYIYTKIFFEEQSADYRNIRHLLVDEMQDYSPVQYAVLAKLFSCKMTILGDSHQSVNPYSSSTIDKISSYFPECDCVELCRTYRSTIEITEFTKDILENKKLLPVQRHGDVPTVSLCKTPEEELHKIHDLLEGFQRSGLTSVGIICKSQRQAEQLYQQLQSTWEGMVLLGFHSTSFQEGIVVTSVHMSKGLEFDQVIVPGISAPLYKTALDRNLLYIACTRAMHKLDLTCWGEKTTLLS